jgi:hypothetical protein
MQPLKGITMSKASASFSLCTVAAFADILLKAKRGAATMHKAVQIAAVHAIGHCLMHGNINLIRQMHLTDMAGVRRDALLAWFETHSNFKYVKDGKLTAEKDERYTFDAKKGFVRGAFDADALLDTPWSGAKKEAAPVSVDDFDKPISAFLKRMANEAMKFPTAKNRDLVAELEATYRKHVAAQYMATAYRDPLIIAAGEMIGAKQAARGTNEVEA